MSRFIIASLLVLSSVAFAEESMSEKAEAKAHDAERAAKKMAHRVEEKVCMKGDAACLKEKAKHRAEEASEYMKDKATETKNAVDSE